MSHYAKGQIWVDNDSKEEFVLYMIGGTPFQPKGFTNHLLVKIGKSGKLLKAKGDNVLAVGHERLKRTTFQFERKLSYVRTRFQVHVR
jgi:hypothetical protein